VLDKQIMALRHHSQALLAELLYKSFPVRYCLDKVFVELCYGVSDTVQALNALDEIDDHYI